MLNVREVLLVQPLQSVTYAVTALVAGKFATLGLGENSIVEVKPVVFTDASVNSIVL